MWSCKTLTDGLSLLLSNIINRQGLVDENGRRAPRDIVQFVVFKDAKSKEDLAAQVSARPVMPNCPCFWHR